MNNITVLKFVKKDFLRDMSSHLGARGDLIWFTYEHALIMHQCNCGVEVDNFLEYDYN